ncbi:MAG: permease prefix domain 1-containing protein [Lachnospiraceae bacterium]|nr:permease prefix domain 1-containing protein [Lachnospiraceae bacterium]
MEKIKEYLNNLFIGLPENPAVLRAKAELLEMMEDKYEELIKEGKSDTEAFGTVISEFGNLEELADALGIKEQLDNSKNANALVSLNKDEEKTKNEEPVEIWDESKMKAFLTLMWKRARLMAMGVALFIIFPSVISVYEAITESVNASDAVTGGISTLIFFVFVTAGVLLCVQSGHIMKTFGYNKKRQVGLSVQAAEALKNQREAEENKLYYMLIAGILLCVFSILPSSIFEPANRVLSEIVSSCFLLFVAAGVYLLVVRGSVLNRYKEFSKSKLYNESQTNEINASYFVESNPKKLSGGGLVLIIVSIILVIGIVITMMMVALFGAIKRAGNLAKEVLETEIVYSEEDFTDLGLFNVNEIDKVAVEGSAANIKVGVSMDDQIHVKFSGNMKTPEVTNEDGNLVIDVNNNNSSAIKGIHLTKSIEDVLGTIYVEIPDESSDLDFEYNMDAGKISMDDLCVNKISFHTEASAIALNDIIANEVSVETEAGALKLEDSVIKDFNAKLDATAIKADNISFENADIETDASAVDIETAEGYECYGFDIESDLAALKIGDDTVVGNYKSDAKDTSNGKHFIRIKSDAAGIRIQ